MGPTLAIAQSKQHYSVNCEQNRRLKISLYFSMLDSKSPYILVSQAENILSNLSLFDIRPLAFVPARAVTFFGYG